MGFFRVLAEHLFSKPYDPLFYSDNKWVLLRSFRGGFHDQGDAKWIVIRGQLRGHNDTLFG
jgi:hypothetical protein